MARYGERPKTAKGAAKRGQQRQAWPGWRQDVAMIHERRAPGGRSTAFHYRTAIVTVRLTPSPTWITRVTASPRVTPSGTNALTW